MIVRFKKIISLLLIVFVLLGQTTPALATDFPTPPPVPTNTQQPPDRPGWPTPPPTPDKQEIIENRGVDRPEVTQPTPTPTPTPVASSQPATTDTSSSNPNENTSNNPPADNQDTSYSAPQTTQSTPEGNQTGNQTENNQTGGTTIGTGDATNNVASITVGNQNSSATPAASDPGGISIVNDSNAQNSTNDGSISVINNDTTLQNNSATVQNELAQTTTTGQNSTNFNNLGDNVIISGDANTSGTVISSINTNVDGIAVSEFNVNENYNGDIILDFGSNCVVGCSNTSDLAQNSNNAQNSTNSANISETNNDTTFQTNDADVLNNLTLASNSGDNDSNFNNNGNNTIVSGDANVSANALTFANNNIAGGVVYAVVNLFGQLTGDIVLPGGQVYSPTNDCSSCPNSNLTASNTNNAQNTTSNAEISQTTTDQTFQTNNADIENNLILDAQTGENTTNANNDGNSLIKTGQANVSANVLNIANSNVEGETWWLVIVNEAGNWVGKILGAPEDQNFAGSAGSEFQVDPITGEITASNSNNAQGSTNNTNISQTGNSLLVQNNDAKVVNNLDLSANTGGNSTIGNNNGNNTIITGDANIVANLVNFVNNNISGSGKLVVVVVNVFEGWLGNFVPPGMEQEVNNLASANTDSNNSQDSSTTPPIGGQNNNPETSNTGSNQAIQATPTPSQTPNPQASSNPSSFFAGALNNATDFLSPQVAGIQIDNLLNNSNDEATTLTNTEAVNKSMRINLAWLLFIIPTLILAFVARRRLLMTGKLAVKASKYSYQQANSIIHSLL